jgi:hypothetical protein
MSEQTMSSIQAEVDSAGATFTIKRDVDSSGATFALRHDTGAADVPADPPRAASTNA